jgi:hypothetical protein
MYNNLLFFLNNYLANQIKEYIITLYLLYFTLFYNSNYIKEIYKQINIKLKKNIFIFICNLNVSL